MAADLLGSMRVEIVGDNRKLDKSIDDSKKKANLLSTGLKSLFAGIIVAVAVKEIAKIGKELIDSASDAEETRNKFNVVFASVANDAKAAADRIRDEFKLSEQTTENFLSGVGDITSGLGATGEEALLAAEKITSLGLDIDSFANLSGGAAQAVSALTSLFTGEREAAKSLGIVINDNNLKQFAEDSGLVFKELSPLEKGFLSLELATEQSQLAIGDFSRSIDSFANQQKIAKSAVEDLKVEIGKRLLPVATESIELFGKLTGALAEFIAERNRLREAEEAEKLGLETVDQRILLIQKENEALQLRFEKIQSGAAANQTLADIDRKIVEEQLAGIKNQIAGNNAIIGVIEKGIKLKELEAAALAKGDLETAERLRIEQELADQRGADTAFRIKTQNELKDTIEKVDEAVAGGLIEGNGLLEKQDALRSALQSLINEGFTAQGKGFETVIQFAKDLNVEIETNIETEIEKAETIETIEQTAAKNRQARREEEEAAENDMRERQIQAAQDAAITMEMINRLGLDSMLLGFEEIGAALFEGEDGFKALGKVALNSIAEIVAALGAQLAAQAALAFFPFFGVPNVVSGIGAAAGSAAAFTAAGAIKAAANSFEDGGVVAGSNFTGDNIPTFQNSGEMDITRQQQSALWRFIQGGSQGTTNNNNSSININSMFSLGNDAKLNEAAEALFPALQKVGRRRGATVGGIG